MLLRHHAVPFAAGDVLVVFLHQSGVAGEGALDLVGPGVCGRILAAGQGQVHRLRVVHFIDIGEGLDREEDEFPVGVLAFRLQREELPQGLRLQADEIVPHLAEFARRQVVGSPVHHFRRRPAAVLAVQVEDARGLVGLVVAECRRAERARVIREVVHRDRFGIPRHREEQVDGIFHRLEVADVQDPDLVHAVGPGELELLPHVLDGRDIQPLGVPRGAHVVHVVVQAPAALPRPFGRGGKLADVAPVVVAQEDGHVVRDTEAQVVVLLDLLVQGPYLRPLLGGLSGHLADDLPLVLDDGLQELDVVRFLAFLAQGGVAVPAHADGDEVFRIFRTLNPFREELREDLLVGRIVPGTAGTPPAGPFLVVPRHRLVMGRAHDDAHLVGRAAVFRIVGVEGPAPHRRPHEIGPEAQQELENARVEAVVAEVCPVGVLHPGGQARGFVVEEDAAVADAGLGDRVGPGSQGDVRAMGDWYVGPVIPGRDAHLLRDLVDAVNGSAHVRARDDDRVAGHLQDVSLVLPVQRGRVDAPFRREALDQRTVLRAGVEDAGALRRRLDAAHAGEVLAQRLRCDEDAPLVGRVRDDGGGDAVFHEGEPAGGRAAFGEARMVEGGGRQAEQQAGREEERIRLVHGRKLRCFECKCNKNESGTPTIWLQSLLKMLPVSGLDGLIQTFVSRSRRPDSPGCASRIRAATSRNIPGKRWRNTSARRSLRGTRPRTH